MHPALVAADRGSHVIARRNRLGHRRVEVARMLGNTIHATIPIGPNLDQSARQA